MEFYSYLVIYLNGELIHLSVHQPKLQISTSKRCSQIRVLSLASSLSHNHALSHATLAPTLDGITVCFEDPTPRLGDSWVDLLEGGGRYCSLWVSSSCVLSADVAFESVQPRMFWTNQEKVQTASVSITGGKRERRRSWESFYEDLEFLGLPDVQQRLALDLSCMFTVEAIVLIWSGSAILFSTKLLINNCKVRATVPRLPEGSSEIE